jgi:hypothetical protein
MEGFLFASSQELRTPMECDSPSSTFPDRATAPLDAEGLNA